MEALCEPDPLQTKAGSAQSVSAPSEAAAQEGPQWSSPATEAGGRYLLQCECRAAFQAGYRRSRRYPWEEQQGRRPHSVAARATTVPKERRIPDRPCGHSLVSKGPDCRTDRSRCRGRCGPTWAGWKRCGLEGDRAALVPALEFEASLGQDAQRERWQSGRMRRTRNPVYGFPVSRVRIPLSPPPALT